MEEFDGSLPKEFVLDKPIEHVAYDIEIIYGLEKQGKLIIEMKGQGLKTFIISGPTGKISFWTDGINEINPLKTARLLKEVTSLNLPPNSMLVGEAVIGGLRDDLGNMQSFLSSTDPKKIAEINSREQRLTYMIFNIIFWDGKRITTPYNETYRRIEELIEGKNLQYIAPAKRLYCSIDEAMRISDKEAYEGLVFYATDYVIGNRTDGKPDPKRPWGCWKWKRVQDGDFQIVYARMREDDPNTVRDVAVCQIDPTNRQIVRTFHFGNFTKKMRVELSNLPMRKTYPKRGKYKTIGWFIDLPVARISFDSRKPKSGMLESPKKFELRDDKPANECFVPKSYPEPEYVKFPMFDKNGEEVLPLPKVKTDPKKGVSKKKA